MHSFPLLIHLVLLSIFMLSPISAGHASCGHLAQSLSQNASWSFRNNVQQQDTPEDNYSEVLSDLPDIASDTDELVAKNTARINVLDKTTGELTEVSIPSGDRLSIGKYLELEVLSCFCSKKHTLYKDNRALIKVYETTSTSPGEWNVIYDGWILSQYPTTSLIQHNKYSLILLSCSK